MADNTIRFRALLDDKVSSGLDKIRERFDKMGGPGSAASFFGNIGAKAVAKGFDLISNAAHSAISFVQGSIMMASDLNETLTKSQQIFGESADSVETWAGTMGKSFGQSKKAALDVASTFAGLFQTVGFAEDEAAEKAKALTELGSDLASFFNTDVAQATQALRSGLAGESEPLRRFNVFLSETAVGAQLIASGQKKVNGQWTEGQKIAARYEIILKQTNAAQGDFARTSDGLANMQRIANAELENYQATLGQKFLPIQLMVTQAQIDFIEGLGVVDKAMVDLTDHVERAGAFLTFWDGTLTQTDLDTQRAAEAVERLGITFDKTWDRAEGALSPMSQSLDTTAKAMTNLGTETVTTTDRLTKGFRDIVTEWTSMRDVLTGQANALADAIWDPIIAKQDLAATEREIAEQRTIQSSKDSSKEQIQDATDRLNELRKLQFQQLATLAAYGDESARLTLEKQVKVLEATKNLSEEQRAELELMRAALRQTATSWNSVYDAANRVRSINPFQWSAKFGGGARAGGGPVWPGTWTVGEEGPETLVLGAGGGGYVLPNNGTGGGGDRMAASPTVIKLVVDGQVLAEVVDRHLFRKLTAGVGFSGAD